MARPPLTLVVCGAPLAARADDVAAELSARWSVTVVATAAAEQWFSADSTVARPRPERVVAFPLTFNTANKVAAGIMDTTACGILCDAIGAGTPVVAVSMINDRLWRHPVWSTTVSVLVAAGVTFLDARTGDPGEPRAVPSGSGPEIVSAFDPRWVAAAVG